MKNPWKWLVDLPPGDPVGRYLVIALLALAGTLGFILCKLYKLI